MPDTPYDILIYGGTVLTMSEDGRIVKDALVAVRDGKIVSVEERAPKEPLPEAVETIDAKGCVVMPGLVNSHTHVPMVCFRGLADDLPLMDWLNNHIFPAEARFVNREMVYAGAMLACAEMILSGTTTFCDSYFYESAVAQAALDSGMRAVVAQGFIDAPVMEGNDPGKQRAVADKFADRWSGYAPLLTPAFFCHSPYTCTPETFRTVKEAARQARVPYLTHLLETKEEIDIVRNRHGKAPLEFLVELGVMDEGTIAVHCEWLAEDDIDTLARLGVKVAHTPESNMKLASGITPVPALLRKGVPVGLGTDGCASNNDLDMFREMDTAAKVHKLVNADPTVMDAETVVKTATLGGARVLGLDRWIGTVEAGKMADIIIVDMNKPHLTPLYNVCSNLVYAASGADVLTSIVNGRIVMKDRRLTTLDVFSVMERVRKIAFDIARG
jgi:5-methylthioadenosine/S-adenosylhomocysteine deaminase